MVEELSDRVERLRSQLKDVHDATPLAVRYEERGREHSAIGFFCQLSSDEHGIYMDMCNFAGTVQDLGRLPSEYDRFRLYLENVLEYVPLVRDPSLPKA